MVNGAVDFVRVDREIDYLAAADTAFEFGPNLVFPTGDYDAMETIVIDVTGNGTRKEVVLLFVARRVT